MRNLFDEVSFETDGMAFKGIIIAIEAGRYTTRILYTVEFHGNDGVFGRSGIGHASGFFVDDVFVVDSFKLEATQ